MAHLQNMKLFSQFYVLNVSFAQTTRPVILLDNNLVFSSNGSDTWKDFSVLGSTVEQIKQAFQSVSTSVDSSTNGLTKMQSVLAGIKESAKTIFQGRSEKLNQAISAKVVQLDIDEEALNDIASSYANATDKAKFLEKTLKDASPEAKKFSKQLIENKESVNDFVAAQQANIDALKQTASSSIGATFRMKALAVAGNIATTAVIALAVSFVANLVTAQQRAIEKAKELTASWKEQQNTYKGNVTSLKSMSAEFSRLAKGVDENGQNVSLSTDEYERYKSLVEQIVALSPQVVKGWNAEGDAIVDNNTAIEEAIQLQKALNEEKRQEYLAQGPELLNGYRAGMNAQLGEVKRLREEINNVFYLEPNDRYTDNVREELEHSLDNIDGLDVSNITKLDTEELLKYSDAIIGNIRKSNLMSETETENLRDQIQLLRVKNEEYKASVSQISGLLREYAQSDTQDAWHDSIQTQYLDEFYSALDSISADSSLSFTEMKVQVRQLGEAFLAMQEQIPTEAVQEIQRQFADGAISSEAFREKMLEQVEAVAALVQQYPQLAPILQMIANGWRDAANSAQSASAVMRQAVPTTQDCINALSDVDKALDGLSAAYKEQNDNAEISNDTLVRLMSEHENWMDLIDVENGVIRLNGDVAKQSARDVINAKIEELESLKELARQNIERIETEIEAMRAYAQAAEAAAPVMAFSLASRTAKGDIAQNLKSIFDVIPDMTNLGAGIKLKEEAGKTQGAIDGIDKTIAALKARLNHLGSGNPFGNIGSSARSAKESVDDLKQAVSGAKSAIESIVSSVVNLIKHQKQQEIANEQAVIDRIKKRYDAQREQEENAWKQKEKHYDEELDRLKDQLSSYQKIIDARKRALSDAKEEADYQKELAERQKEIADLENTVAELANDTSAEGVKRRLELEEELAGKRSEMEDFQAGHAYDTAIDELDKELDVYEEKINGKIANLEREREYERLQHEARMLELENENNYEIQAHEEKIQRLQDYMSQEGLLRQEAMNQITTNIQNTDLQSNDLYQKLLEWNRLYGTGIDQDITNAWWNAYGAMQTFGGEEWNVYNTLSYLTTQMGNFEASVKRAAAAMQTLANASQRVVKHDTSAADFKKFDYGEMAGNKGYKHGGKVTKERAVLTGFDKSEPDAVLIKAHVGETVIPKETNALQSFSDFLNSDIPAEAIFAGHPWNNQVVEQYVSKDMAARIQSVPNVGEVQNIQTAAPEIIFQTTIQGNADRDVMEQWYAQNKRKMQSDFIDQMYKHMNKSAFYRGVTRNAKHSLI